MDLSEFTDMPTLDIFCNELSDAAFIRDGPKLYATLLWDAFRMKANLNSFANGEDEHEKARRRVERIRATYISEQLRLDELRGAVIDLIERPWNVEETVLFRLQFNDPERDHLNINYTVDDATILDHFLQGVSSQHQGVEEAILQMLRITRRFLRLGAKLSPWTMRILIDTIRGFSPNVLMKKALQELPIAITHKDLQAATEKGGVHKAVFKVFLEKANAAEIDRYIRENVGLAVFPWTAFLKQEVMLVIDEEAARPGFNQFFDRVESDRSTEDMMMTFLKWKGLEGRPYSKLQEWMERAPLKGVDMYGFHWVLHVANRAKAEGIISGEELRSVVQQYDEKYYDSS